MVASIPYSDPYWLNEKHGEGIFVIRDRMLIGNPENITSTNVIFNLEIDGLPLQIEKSIIYKYTDPVKGEIYRPYEIVPPATINIAEKVYIFTDSKPKTIQFIIKAKRDNKRMLFLAKRSHDLLRWLILGPVLSSFELPICCFCVEVNFLSKILNHGTSYL